MKKTQFGASLTTHILDRKIVRWLEEREKKGIAPHRLVLILLRKEMRKEKLKTNSRRDCK